MHDAAADDDDVDLILEEDDDPADERVQRERDADPWRILIADDEVDVHVVTKFALNNIEFQGRRLSYLHAYSADETIRLVRATPRIALVLLDVVMEAPDAGLQVARRIRDELGNLLVRIVLRTGLAAQQDSTLLLDYDVNDFWSKADLTTHKLVTTVISSLRTYGALAAASDERAALRARVQQAERVRAALDRYLPLLVLDRHGRVIEASGALCELLGMPVASLLGRLASALAALAAVAPPLEEIAQALSRREAWRGAVELRRPGAPLALQCVVQELRGVDGRVSGYLVLGSLAGPVGPREAALPAVSPLSRDRHSGMQ